MRYDPIFHDFGGEVSEDEVPVISIDLEEPFDQGSLEAYINKTIGSAKKAVDLEFAFIPKLIVLESSRCFIVPIDSGTPERMAETVDTVEKLFDSMVAVVYVIESWSLTAPSDEAGFYVENPTEVVENPFKDEVLVVYAWGFGKEYYYLWKFERDDSGNIVWKEFKEMPTNGYKDIVVDKIRSKISI